MRTRSTFSPKTKPWDGITKRAVRGTSTKRYTCRSCGEKAIGVFYCSKPACEAARLAAAKKTNTTWREDKKAAKFAKEAQRVKTSTLVCKECRRPALTLNGGCCSNTCRIMWWSKNGG